MADMEAPPEAGAAPVHESSRGQKRRASRSPLRSLSPVSKACFLGTSSTVSIVHFKTYEESCRASNTVSEIVFPRTPEDLRYELGKTPRSEIPPAPDAPPPMYIVHGLPTDFLDVIGECMDIDKSFVEAHAARVAYWPKDIVKKEVTWAHWEYPELVTCVDGSKEQDDKSGMSSGAPDIMSPPLVKTVDNTGLSVVFRRVSMWIGDLGDVVLMDTPLWKNQELLLATRSQVLVAKSHPRRGLLSWREPGSWVTRGRQQETIPSLEERLYKAIKRYGERDYTEIPMIVPLVLEKWLELFRALPSPESGCYSAGGGGLLWQMMQSMEQNLQALKEGAYPGDGEKVWNDLLKRLQRTLNFATRATFTNQDTTTNKAVPPKQALEDPQRKPMPEAILERTYSQGEILDWEQINRRSLDRITYLGGILLPLTVVSGILGIEGRYGPEGTQFWVFWVASFVSSSICIFIIYLDQLRGLDIWFEVTANDAVEAMFQRYPSAFSYQRESGVESVQSAGVAGVATGGNALPRVFSNRNGHVAFEEGGKLHYLTSSGSSGLARRTIWFENSKGSGGKTWKRGSLGWGGAVKKTVGYYRFKGGNMRFNRPGPGDDEG